MKNLNNDSVFGGNWKRFNYNKLIECLNLLPDKDLMNDITIDDKIRWMTYLYSAPKILSNKGLNNRNHIIKINQSS